MLSKLQNPEFWKEKILNDLYFLCRCVLQTLESPHYGYQDLWKPTHQRMANFVSKYAQPEHSLLILAPRGWVKSYVITVGWLVQRILKNIVAGRKEHILLTNATLDNSRQFLRKVKYNLEHNAILKAVFNLYDNPEKEADRWTMDDIDYMGTSIEIGAVEGNLVSRHYNVIIHDDLVNWENSRTPDQIRKVIDWWKLAHSLLESKGLEILIGTRWAVDDLYGYFIENFLNLREEEKKSFRENPYFEKSNGNYHMLYISCWENPLEESGSTFPTLFPEAKLKEIKRQLGNHFSGQYLNDPLSMNDTTFNEKWFRTWYQLPSVYYTYLLVDPAGGKPKERSDYSAIVVVSAGCDKNLYVRYAAKKKLTDLQLAEWIIEVALRFRPYFIGIEEGKLETLRSLMEFVIPQMKAMGKIPNEIDYDYKSLPMMAQPLKHRNRPKFIRIGNLSGWIENGRLLFAQDGMSALKSELIHFEKTRHDDLADALAYILDVVSFPMENEMIYHPKPEVFPKASTLLEQEWRELEELGWCQ